MKNRLILFFGIIMLSACGTTETLIVRKPVKTDNMPLSTLLKNNRQHQEKIQYLKALTTLNLESPKSGSQVKGQIAIKYPDSIYIKIEGFLGIDGLVASINKNTFVVYNILNKYVVTGSTTPGAIQKAFDYKVTFDELRDVMTGLVFLSDRDREQIVSYDADSCYYVLKIKEDSGYKKVWIDPWTQFAVTKIEHYNADDEVMMLKEFSRFEQYGSMMLPKYVRVLRPKEKDLLSVYFEERIINKKFPSKLFHIHYPKNIEVIDESQIKIK
jgi:outer membrane lipoprotein-sorting protein